MHSSSNPTITGFLIITLFFILTLAPLELVTAEAKCWKRKYYVTILGTSAGGKSVGLNTTVGCPEYYSWTISDYCCYDGYDRFDTRPFCCYSETYKLAVAVGLICLVLLGISCSFFLCWLYNLPHYFLSVITCGKFSLNDYMKKSMLNGPYVDPSFYTGEPFWSSANLGVQPYPLRPMPPGIFYPTGSVMKSRWSSQHFMSTGQMPLFVVASRQFTRNPYSARPNDRQNSVYSISSFTGHGHGHGHATGGGGAGQGTSGQDSRRSSTTSNYKADSRLMPTLNFRVNIDEVEAAAELLEALKRIENKDKGFAIPRLVEETQNDLDLDESESSLSLGRILDGDAPGAGTSTSMAAMGPKKQLPRGAPAVPTHTSVSVPGSRKNSIIPTTRIGSSTKIVPIKSRRDRRTSLITTPPTHKMKEDDDENDEDDEDFYDDDEDDDDDLQLQTARFIVPVKSTIANELGNKLVMEPKQQQQQQPEFDNKYALESIKVQEETELQPEGKKKVAAAGKVVTIAGEVASPGKRNIPGLITEVGQ